MSPEMSAYYSCPEFLVYNAAYKAACEADKAYSAELQKVYGNNAGNARYHSGLNVATKKLKALQKAWKLACIESERTLVILRSTQAHKDAFGW